MYSKSGLFMESQIDMVSSIETDSPERPGDMKLLQVTKAGAQRGTSTVVGVRLIPPVWPNGQLGLDPHPNRGCPTLTMVGGPPSHSAIKREVGSGHKA